MSRGLSYKDTERSREWEMERRTGRREEERGGGENWQPIPSRTVAAAQAEGAVLSIMDRNLVLSRGPDG